MKGNILSCARCRHTWQSKAEKTPKYCPNCKSPYWNKPRKRISKENIDNFKTMIIQVHEEIISTSGGEQGIRDDGGIYFSTYALLKYIENHAGDPTGIGAFAYSEFARKHHFVDGNKRTAYVIAKMVMLSFRCHLKTDYGEALPFIMKIAEYNSKVSFEEIKSWLKENCEIIQEKDMESYLNKILVGLMLEEKKDGNKED